MSYYLSNGDVISMLNNQSLLGSSLFKMEHFEKQLNGHLGGDATEKLLSGVDCELLSPNFLGWKKGKLRLRLEFEPVDENLPPS